MEVLELKRFLFSRRRLLRFFFSISSEKRLLAKMWVDSPSLRGSSNAPFIDELRELAASEEADEPRTEVEDEDSEGEGEGRRMMRGKDTIIELGRQRKEASTPNVSETVINLSSTLSDDRPHP